MLKIVKIIKRDPDKKQISYVYKNKHRIKLSDGCPHMCPFCHEHNQYKEWTIPNKFKTEKVELLDMNFLYRHDALKVLKHLEGKAKEYKAICGFDTRLLTEQHVEALKRSRFKDIKIAWDWGMQDQYRTKKALRMILKNYSPKEVSVFVLANWEIPLWKCELKIDMLKSYKVKVCDCCYDGGYNTPAEGYWSQKEREWFRHRCAIHNQLVLFGLYPHMGRIKRTEWKKPNFWRK